MSLFSDFRFHVSLSLSADVRDNVLRLITLNGGTEVSSLNKATHIITNSNRFEGWNDVDDEVPIVTPDWVERSMVLGKLQPIQHYSADPAMLFSGVSACSADLSPADIEVISSGITSLGGQWKHSLTREVTHIFALTAGSEKYVSGMKFKERATIKILLPHWFDDVMRLGMRSLCTAPYEWPDPAYLKSPNSSYGDAAGETLTPMKNGRQADNSKRTFFKTALWDKETEIPDFPPKTNVWHKRRILLSSSLKLPDGRAKAIESEIKRAGGVVVHFPANIVDDIDDDDYFREVDVFITRYRSGKAFFKCATLNKTIGTLAWLFNCHATGTISRPQDQLLHFPVPKQPIKGFSGHLITITNYTGDAREYLKKLLDIMGAKFTPSMTPRNTVVVAAFIQGKKTESAQNWSIPIVNHTWLEDCYVKWRNLTVANEKYINFPPGVDFAALLAECGIGRNVEDVDYLQDLEKEDAALPVNTQNSAKDADEVEAMARGQVIVHVPNTPGHAPLSQSSPRKIPKKREEYSKESPAAVKAPVKRAVEVLLPRLPSSSPEPVEEVVPRRGKKGKDREVNQDAEDTMPAPRLKRGAAARADAKLKDAILDKNKYDQERRSGRYSVGSSKRSTGEEGEPPAKRRKSGGGDERVNSHTAPKAKFRHTESLSDDESVVSSHWSKRGTVGPRGPREKQAVIVKTKYEFTNEVMNGLGKLGVKISDTPRECTHLVATQIVRTEKFLCSLAKSPFVLLPDWAEESAAAGKLLPEENYLLEDPEAEKRWHFKLRDSLLLARKNNSRLLGGLTFFITPNVRPERGLLKAIIEANGGELSGKPVSGRVLDAHRDRYLVSCTGDEKIWRPVSSKHIVYTPELILSAALKQKLELDNEKFFLPEDP